MWFTTERFKNIHEKSHASFFNYYAKHELNIRHRSTNLAY